MAVTSMSTRAYLDIRRMIVQLDLAPNDVIREDELQKRLRLGRTPIREALQRLARDQFVTVVPRRGMYVSAVEFSDLPTLYETRTILEPYAVRLACARGTEQHWKQMAKALSKGRRTASANALLNVDRACREIVWDAAGNRFLTTTLDMLYSHSERLWHLYVGEVDDVHAIIGEHQGILDGLRNGDADRAARLSGDHMRRFNDEIAAAAASHS